MYAVVDHVIDADVVRRAVAGGRNGAVVVFHGTVRDHTGERRVTHLEYEAYAPMAVARMRAIGEEVVERHALSALACVHRVGRLEIGDVAVVVATSSPHRRAALEAVETYVTRLKQDVPIWKKEFFEGGAAWIGTPTDPQGQGTAPA